MRSLFWLFSVACDLQWAAYLLQFVIVGLAWCSGFDPIQHGHCTTRPELLAIVAGYGASCILWGLAGSLFGWLAVPSNELPQG